MKDETTDEVYKQNKKMKAVITTDLETINMSFAKIQELTDHLEKAQNRIAQLEAWGVEKIARIVELETQNARQRAALRGLLYNTYRKPYTATDERQRTKAIENARQALAAQKESRSWLKKR